MVGVKLLSVLYVVDCDLVDGDACDCASRLALNKSSIVALEGVLTPLGLLFLGALVVVVVDQHGRPLRPDRRTRGGGRGEGNDGGKGRGGSSASSRGNDVVDVTGDDDAVLQLVYQPRRLGGRVELGVRSQVCYLLVGQGGVVLRQPPQHFNLIDLEVGVENLSTVGSG